jgi:hypothetical protein
MNITLVDEKIKYLETQESFFTFNNQVYHEIFFVYKYLVDENDYQALLQVKDNKDNHITDYMFVNYDQFDEVNLLPLEIRDTIEKC